MKIVYKVQFLTFESTLTLLNEHKVADKDFQEDVKQKVNYFHEKSKVLNTERSAKNWIKKFNDFRKDYGYLIPLSELSDIKQLEKELANSIKQAVDAIDRYLQRELGEVTGSLALNTEQVQQILQYPRMNCEEPENLLYRVFFLISILFAMHGGEHYNIKIDQFKFDNCGLKFSRYTSKNNQQSSFYLQPNSNWLATSIWYKSNYIGKNKLSHKTAAQYLQDNNVPEQAIMELTGHKSVEGVRAYKKINEEQKSFTINTLINITDN
ncbi:hypothetical protein Glove_78g62 [Diversispora epigaea]|uniref:Tyr recombinase domain-containing protein n=1 Tax=Diversispora epigaea TaxID=1348612 RepID=A0A397JC15_9GLOM|nr:hypothetical protein Glove_78g62 [Diversispora epigaea]